MRIVVKVLAVLLLLLYWSACASTGYPTGGPKDEDPPVMVKSSPPANALNFLGDQIRIEFDENIQLTDVFQKLMVSPPVNTQPSATARGNVLLVQFDEELQQNATYTLDFADAVRDNNEGNILENFTFSFSTGEYIDSLAISGHLFEAADLAPVSEALVMVYADAADSLFRSRVPLRVTRTSSNGFFSIQNLAPGSYKVYGLEDSDRNFRYDQPGERIAFLSDLVVPSVGFHERLDSISADSVAVVREQAFLPDSLQLFMFQEDNAPQYLVDYKRDERHKLDFIFNRPLEGRLEVEVPDYSGTAPWVFERSLQNDSITLWLSDSTLIRGDSLFLALSYPVRDSLQEVVLERDTVNAYFFDRSPAEEEGRSRRNRKEEEAPVVVPDLKLDGLKNSLEITETLAFSFAAPLEAVREEGLCLFEVVDSVPQLLAMTLQGDSVRLRRFTVDFERRAGASYVLEVDSAAFISIYGVANKPLKHSFSVKSEDSYGIMYFDFEKPGAHWLLQVLDRKEQVLRQAAVPANGKMGFRYLKPGDYLLRIVEDVNGNGRWDTGQLDVGLQPERLIYYPETVSIRANWDHMVPWDPADFDIYGFVERMRKSSTGNRQR
ncbi:Ig-like domain-containing protein [Geofilum rhodophaeum]|uniref:Ig-like domain-containing protein n=1 Tax=Geofilum rhodophaeum TaxID=1965019 RepID=UPI000B52468A|nr:Ig-like domain-containing protein [Geofilum rhodophaeum]